MLSINQIGILSTDIIMHESALIFLNDDNQLDIESLFFSTLLVYPNSEIGLEIANIFKQLIGELHRAETGEEALKILESEYLELLVMPMSLSDMSGITLINTILHYRPHLPILILTYREQLEGTLVALREGAWDYVIVDCRDSLHDKISISLNRIGEKKVELIRENSLRAERLAFWSAAHRAKDGLAFIGIDGTLSFMNPSFQNFISLFSDGCNNENTLNLVDLLAKVDNSLAEQLSTAFAGLQNSGAGVWSTEIGVKPVTGLEISDKKQYFRIELSTISIAGIERLEGEGDRYVLWVSDVTAIKEHEQFQGDLISTTSHDLKGPLGVISCAAEMLLEEHYTLSLESKNLLHLIMSSAKKSQVHIEEFLNDKRMEAGVLVVEPCEHDLKVLLEEVIEEYTVAARQKNIIISVNTEQITQKIYADSIAFNRLLGNILSNAVKYVTSGGTVFISSESSASHVKILIRDDGPGISHDAQHTLFDRFSRLKRDEATKGSGLGLFIVKKIIEAHNGRVEVQSEPGVGTLFTLYFPHQPL